MDLVLAVQDQSPVRSSGTAFAAIEQTAAVHGVDEIVIVTICHGFEARLRSYQLVAEAFGLAAARSV